MADEKDKPKYYPESTIHPTDEYMEEVGKTFDSYYRWRLQMSNEWQQLQGYNLVNYVKKARAKMYGFEPINAENDLNQRPVFLSHEFRNQAEQTLTSIANLSQNPKFFSTEGLDFQIAELLNGLHRHATRGTEKKLENLLDYWHTMMDGTVIKFVSYAPRRKKVKNVKAVDLTTGHIEYVETEIKEGEVEETLVDITDFYVPKIFEPNLQKQGKCIWRSLMTWKDFQASFEGYPYADAVVPGSYLVTDSIFAKILDKTILAGDKVEVLREFDWVNDRYKLIANGIWINPVKGSKDEVSPLPWNHKMAPFAKTTYRFIDGQFFYGPAMPHLVKSPVEAREELAEMKLDRVFRSLNPPTLTTEPTIPQNFKLESGAIYKTNVNPTSEWREMQMNPMDANVWRMDMDLDSMTSRIATPTGMQGNNVSRQPRSAAEKIQQMQERVAAFSFQKTFFQHLLEQKAILTVENLLQFYTSTDMEKVVGKKKYLNILKVENVPMKSGIANLEMRFVKSKKGISDPVDLMRQKLFKAIFNHENTEIIEISEETLRDLNFMVEIDFNQEETPELKKAMFLDFVNFLMQHFPQQLDMNKLLFRTFEIWNENPADYIPDQMVSQYPAYLSGMGIQQPQQQGGNPLQQLMQGMGGQVQGGGQMPNNQNAPTMQRIQQSMLRGPASGRGNTKFGQRGVNLPQMVA